MSAHTDTIREALALFRPEKGGHDLTTGETSIDAEHSLTCRRCAAEAALAALEREHAEAVEALAFERKPRIVQAWLILRAALARVGEARKAAGG